MGANFSEVEQQIMADDFGEDVGTDASEVAVEDAVEEVAEEEVADEAEGSEEDNQEEMQDDAEREVSWGEFKALRHENAQLRQRLKGTNEVAATLDGWPEEARRGWAELIDLTASNPVAAAEQMQALANQLLGVDDVEAESQDSVESEETPEGYVSADAVQRMIDQALGQREQERQMEQVAREMREEAKSLGYEVGSEEYRILMSVVASTPNIDLKTADEMLKGFGQKNVDKYVKSKAQKAQDTPKLPGSGSASIPANKKPITNFDEADAEFKKIFG